MALPSDAQTMSFLRLEKLTVFVTGAGSSIGRCAVREFLSQGCYVAAHDVQSLDPLLFGSPSSRLHCIHGDITNEDSIRSCIESASQKFGPINILVANAGALDKTRDLPIWELPADALDDAYRTNTRGTFLVIKHFLRAARTAQAVLRKELDNLAIVITGSGFSQAGRSELVRVVTKDITKINREARVNAVEWALRESAVHQPQREGSGSDSTYAHGAIYQLWNISTDPHTNRTLGEDVADSEAVAKAILFLASHRAAGHITGESLTVASGIDKDLRPKETEPFQPSSWLDPKSITGITRNIPRSLSSQTKPKVRVALSIDLDAVSGWLGTGTHPDNILADYSAGFFAAKVGVPRLLKMLTKQQVAHKCTWFIPGHSAESFKEEVQQVVQSGCEIGLHGYAHEGAYQLTPEQERDVLVKCIKISSCLTGKKPVGYRAPLYQIRETTLDLLEEYGFLYDASLTDRDCHPFFAPRRPAIQPIDFSRPASSWMNPIQDHGDRRPLVEVPCNWYMEDMTPMQFLPHAPNSHGYVDVRVIEQLWKDRFMWIMENEEDAVFPLLMHPDTSGMAHVIGMIERVIKWLKSWGSDVEFCQTGEIARWFRDANANR